MGQKRFDPQNPKFWIFSFFLFLHEKNAQNMEFPKTPISNIPKKICKIFLRMLANKNHWDNGVFWTFTIVRLSNLVGRNRPKIAEFSILTHYVPHASHLSGPICCDNWCIVRPWNASEKILHATNRIGDNSIFIC